jgi:glycerol-3-phosphate O-acyltransferase 3/4
LSACEHVNPNRYVLDVMENMWFDRMASKDRKYVAQRIKEHAADVTKPPLLVFPEGTCVNNEHIVMFKRGAFSLGTSIVPVAIKFNTIFVDGYWNSREQSIQHHMLRLMTAWALVVEVKYLDPQRKRRGETATAFASRVKHMIAKAAGLKAVPWDGYLKYYTPRPEYKDSRVRVYAKMLRQRFKLGPIPPNAAPEIGANLTTETVTEVSEVENTQSLTAGLKHRKLPRTASEP